jgi:predicted GIY-YIG superfamily endonuclease
VLCVFGCENTLRRELMHVNPNKKPLPKNAVYQIKCECGKVYIGQTLRAVEKRVIEHMKKIGKTQDENCSNYNHLAGHVQKTNHTVDFTTVAILYYEEKRIKRVIAESFAMYGKSNVISQASKVIDKIFWPLIDSQLDRLRKMYSEKDRLNVGRQGALQPPRRRRQGQ